MLYLILAASCLILTDAKKFKEVFEKSLKDIEKIIGKKVKNSEDESKTLVDELTKLKVATEKADDEDSDKKVNGHEKEDEENAGILEGKESED